MQKNTEENTEKFGIVHSYFLLQQVELGASQVYTK